MTDAAREPGDTGNRDAATLLRLRAQDPDGLRHLLEDHGGAVLQGLGKAFGHFLTGTEVEEAFGAAMVRIWETPHVYAPGLGSLRAWMFVVARNCALSLVRSQRRRRRDVPLEQIEELLPRLAPNQAEQARLCLLADLQGCLGELSPLQRAVLQADLDANGAATTDQLVERLGVSARSIYVARHLGRIALGRMMQRLGHYTDQPIAPPDTAGGMAPEFG